MIKILVSVLIIVALLASGTQAFANEVFKPLDTKLKAKKLFKKSAEDIHLPQYFSLKPNISFSLFNPRFSRVTVWCIKIC
jgi:hypothetical protein